MIVNDGLHYLYRHVRLDTNTVFYVGIGTKGKSDTLNGQFSRAFNCSMRNMFWKRVVAKTKHEVHIILESNDRDFIERKEIEFIKLYGRKDLHLGELTNQNDGGSSRLNPSKISIEKAKNTAKENGWHDINIKRLKEYNLVHNKNNTFNCKETFIYDLSGTLVKCVSRKECQSFTKASKGTIAQKIKDKESCNGYYITEFFTEKLDTSLFTEFNKTRQICKICPKTLLVIEEFDSLQNATGSTKAYGSGIWHAIPLFSTCMGFYWSYKDNVHDYLNKLRSKNRQFRPPKMVINSKTGELYNNLSEAASKHGIARTTLRNKLEGISVNNTSLNYLKN